MEPNQPSPRSGAPRPWLAAAAVAALIGPMLAALGLRPDSRGAAAGSPADPRASASAGDADAPPDARRSIEGPAPSSADLLRLAPGTRVELRASCASLTEFRSDQGSLHGASAIEVGGTLSVQILDRRPGEVLLHLAWIEPLVVVREGGAPVPSPSGLVAELARGVSLRLDDEGRTLAYRFSAQGPLQTRNLWRMWVDALRFVVPAEAGRAWTISEQGSEGPLVVAFERVQDGAGLVRRRSPSREHPSLRTIEGEALLRLDGPAGWPRELRLEERATHALPGGQARHTLRIEGEFSLPARAPIPVELAHWRGPWSPVSGAEDASRVADERTELAWREALRGRALGKLVGDLEASLDADGASVEDPLAALTMKLRLEPGAAAELAPLVRQPALGERAARLLLLAAAEAGTDACQALLGELAADAALSLERRELVLSALFSVRAAGERLLSSVAALLEDPTCDARLAERGLLALGSMVHRAGADPRSVTHLLALEDAAREQGRTGTWLYALSNAGSVEALPRIEACAREADPALRAAAAHALRRVPGEPALGLLDRLAGDEHPAVRAQALGVLGASSPAPRLALLEPLLATETEPAVRQALVDALGRRGRPSAQERELLRSIQRRDPDARIRDLAGALLARRHGEG